MNLQRKLNSSNGEKMYGIYDNRELSWLKFNMRVLEEAENESVPPLERLRFLGIVTSNLDEFFMVRVGGIIDKIILEGDKCDDKSDLKYSQQLELIYKNTRDFYKKKKSVYDSVKEGLLAEKIKISGVQTLSGGKKNILDKKFADTVRPLLSLQVVNPKNPFPHLENKAVYTALQLVQKDRKMLGLIMKSRELPEIISIENNDFCEMVITDEVIFEYADKLFSEYRIEDKCMIRVTRNADMDILENEYSFVNDYRLKMKKILKKRKRRSPVRIEISKQISKDFKKLVLNDADPNMLVINKNPLSFGFASELIKALPKETREKLSFEAFVPDIPKWYTPSVNMLDIIRKEDILLNYPYDSMKPFLSFLEQAACDEKVTSIKITLYRLSTNSRVINSLIKAAEYGKDVLVIMELRARFDEETNISYSEILEENGVRVIYGPENYKVHSKVCSVVRINGTRTEYFSHFGTGNYNESTARQYTDMNLFTSDEEIGKDALLFFDNISTNNLLGKYNKLVTSPCGIENLIIEKLDELTAYQNASAILKCNSLTSKTVIDKIAEVCEKGVKINLIVRGVCCIVPSFDKLKENLKIISVVGRFLEHSRIYAFLKDEKSEVYISSADLMTRNLKNRVETAVPIENEALKGKTVSYLKTILKDDVKARELTGEGNYVNVTNMENFDSQLYFIKREDDISNEIKVQVKKYPNFFKWLFV